MDLRTFRALAGDPGVQETPPAPCVPDGSVTVSELNEYIRSLLSRDARLLDVAVRGEISNFIAHRSGHCYFSLKDEGGLIRCVMFRSYAERLRFRPENGMKVILHGSVTVYTRDGQYQIVTTAMEPDGIGALYLAFEQRKRKLEAEGLFDESRKRPLPRLPRRIGVITSPTGAAIRDILDILKRRFPLAEVRIYPALVQGDGAPPQLIAGLRFFNENRAADLLIIGRGGGSMEDLFAFNDEELVREVAASAIPVISAVGHETDFTLCDFAADRRAPTPSAAAELAVPDVRDLAATIGGFSGRMRASLDAKIRRDRRTLELLANRPVMRRPDAFLDERRQELDDLTAALQRAGEKTVRERRELLSREAARLEALSPLAVLSRGYCAAFAPDAGVITSVGGIREGDSMTLRFGDGEIDARAETVRKKEARRARKEKRS